ALLDEGLDVVGSQYARARDDLALAFGLERAQLEVQELREGLVEQDHRHLSGDEAAQAGSRQVDLLVSGSQGGRTLDELPAARGQGLLAGVVQLAAHVGANVVLPEHARPARNRLAVAEPDAQVLAERIVRLD